MQPMDCQAFILGVARRLVVSLAFLSLARYCSDRDDTAGLRLLEHNGRYRKQAFAPAGRGEGSIRLPLFRFGSWQR